MFGMGACVFVSVESARGIVVNQMCRRLLGLTVQVGGAYCMFAVTWFDLFFVPFMSQIGDHLIYY